MPQAERAAAIYKICRRGAWDEARQLGRFAGSADDLRDGYIHLSTASQVATTLTKHFAGQTDLVLIGVDPERLGAALRWEPSRGGELFPHLYGPLDIDAVVSEAALALDENGCHSLPQEFRSC